MNDISKKVLESYGIFEPIDDEIIITIKTARVCQEISYKYLITILNETINAFIKESSFEENESNSFQFFQITDSKGIIINNSKEVLKLARKAKRKIIDYSHTKQFQISILKGSLYISSDYGGRWTKTLNNLSNFRSVLSSSSGQFYSAINSDNEVFTSEDYGTTWKIKEYSEPFTAVTFENGEFVPVVEQDFKCKECIQDSGLKQQGTILIECECRKEPYNFHPKNK